MTAISTTKIASNVIHEENSLDPRIFFVIDDIRDDVTYQRIVHNIPYGLDLADMLLIASMLNDYYPPTVLHDVARCLGDGTFTVIVNHDTHKLEWESDSTRWDQAGEWKEGDNAFGYRPPDRRLLTALQFDGTHIQFIDNSTEEMKLAAVKRTSAAIEYIINPSDAVKRAASIKAAAERPYVRAGFVSKYRPLAEDGTAWGGNCDCGCNGNPYGPHYSVQGVRPSNPFSDMLLWMVMELNGRIGNNEIAADFLHVSQTDGELVVSFSSMRQLLSMRFEFLEFAFLRGIEGEAVIAFEAMDVIAYPNANGPGFITWGAAAAVSEFTEDASWYTE